MPGRTRAEGGGVGHQAAMTVTETGARRGTPARVETVLIVDDHPLMCDALALTLKMALALKRTRTARSLAAAVESIRAEGAPDAIVLDLSLPDAGGTEGIVTLSRLAPGVPITLISAHDDPKVISAALGAGARGYVSKSLSREAMTDAFARMWAGEVVVPPDFDPGRSGTAEASQADLMRRFATLTPQQMRILRLICLGKANKEISYELSIAEATVKTHITAIMAKINARRRTQAVLLANTARLFDHG